MNSLGFSGRLLLPTFSKAGKHRHCVSSIAIFMLTTPKYVSSTNLSLSLSLTSLLIYQSNCLHQHLSIHRYFKSTWPKMNYTYSQTQCSYKFSLLDATSNPSKTYKLSSDFHLYFSNSSIIKLILVNPLICISNDTIQRQIIMIWSQIY